MLVMTILCIYLSGVLVTQFFCIYLRDKTGNNRKGDIFATNVLSIFSWIGFLAVLLIGAYAVYDKKK